MIVQNSEQSNEEFSAIYLTDRVIQIILLHGGVSVPQQRQ